MKNFSEQGTGPNVLPHLLTAVLEVDRYGANVLWKVRCPGETEGLASLPCGVLEECDREECRQPQPLAERSPEESDDARREAWSQHMDALVEWREEHGNEGMHHTGDCWFRYMVESREADPERFLAELPNGMVLSGPLWVLVGNDGSDEDPMPAFRIWNYDEQKDTAR